MATESRYIQLMDTTLRDGEQTQGVSFTPAEKVNIAKALLQWLRVDRIEVASARVSQGEKEAVASINEWASQEGFGGRVEVLGFVDHTRSVDWILETGGSVINLLTKGSEKHCREQLGKTLEQHTQDIQQTIDYAQQKGLTVNVYLEDWSNGYQNSPEYVFGLMDNLKDAGISHFMLPDTLGVMSPDEVFASIGDMCRRYPALQFDFHPHNDYGLATANVMAAVRAGVSSVHCTVNCLGERAGNASLAEVAVVLRDKMAMELSIDETHIVRISQMVENFSGKRIAANAPIIGSDVFTQTAGIHADGDHKGGLYKTRLSPERFSRTRSYALGKMSGKASLKKNLELLEVDLSEENQKKVLARIVQLGDSKQTITTDDLPFIIADVLESKSYEHIRLLNCSITSGLHLESTASLRVEVNGEKHQTSGSGNGGFDAFIDAIDKVLKLHDYTLPALADYEVRIPKGGHTDALTECVITWDCGTELRKTRGVHANQVFAGVMATLKIINMQLHELKTSQA
ncbi:alpha-isopropylmalate synthase regulatory domain-containing protein [Methylomicrobium sp. RS1]|jgi:D-citramalate synthase|uniref:alpha-isopropylmalate synthase regulatory domain-containing protein n=1 Tax=Candidatus Methylomicrobium oryzae TaxID=2802053 RepID=UPI00192220AF|nr:alpha-isopropylmalate synthase regulatory domain-containing protein [Methylomicrobium sp. RS1]MBL1264909.1 2-isopropylmalate synthase [Methylomicrobium sp. RS1]